LTLGLKEAIVGLGLYSQRAIGKKIANINSEATAMGTERNEKIARWMISGLDPEGAIALYNADKDALVSGQEALKLYSTFYFWDYITGDSQKVRVNLQNQIDAKDSRIAEAIKFAEGLTTADVQAAIKAVDAGEEQDLELEQ